MAGSWPQASRPLSRLQGLRTNLSVTGHAIEFKQCRVQSVMGQRSDAVVRIGYADRFAKFP